MKRTTEKTNNTKIGRSILSEALTVGKDHTIIKCHCGGHSWAIIETPFDPDDMERDDTAIFVCLTCHSYRVAVVQSGRSIGAPVYLDKYSRERHRALDRATATYNRDKEHLAFRPMRRGELVYWKITHSHSDRTGCSVQDDHEVSHERVQWLWSKIIRHLDKQATAKDCFAKIIKVLGLTGTVTVESFNGGKNRAFYYFPYYYWPIKVLHFLGYIRMRRGSKKFERLTNTETVVISPAFEIYNADKGQSTLEGFKDEQNKDTSSD